MEGEPYKKILFKAAAKAQLATTVATKAAAQVEDNKINNKENLEDLKNQYMAIKANQNAVINKVINRT